MGGRWYFSGSSTIYDYLYVLKVVEDGSKKIEKTYGSSGNDRVIAVGIVETDDGNFLIAGNVRSLYTGQWSLYLAEIDLDGDILWEAKHGFDGQMVRILLNAPQAKYRIAGTSRLEYKNQYYTITWSLGDGNLNSITSRIN